MRSLIAFNTVLVPRGSSKPEWLGTRGDLLEMANQPHAEGEGRAQIGAFGARLERFLVAPLAAKSDRCVIRLQTFLAAIQGSAIGTTGDHGKCEDVAASHQF
jgi:hypothetical protein